MGFGGVFVLYLVQQAPQFSRGELTAFATPGPNAIQQTAAGAPDDRRHLARTRSERDPREHGFLGSWVAELDVAELDVPLQPKQVLPEIVDHPREPVAVDLSIGLKR